MSSTTPAIYQIYTDNILLGITPTGTAPSSSYSMATFLTLRPSARIRWSTGTVTVTYTLGGAVQGDILMIAMHGIDVGSGVLTLTNNNGFSQAITVPAKFANGFPPTLVVDLTGLASAATRTASVWNLVIAGNSTNLVMGAAVAIYGPKRTFDSLMGGNNISWGMVEDEESKVLDTENEYGVDYIQDYDTFKRTITGILPAYVSGVAAIRDLYRAGHGRARASLLWIDPTVTDALFGRPAQIFSVTHNFNKNRPIGFKFDELSKGLHI